MNRKHAAVIAALLGAAIAAGAFAATRTSAAAETGRGGASEQAIVERSRSLDEIERSLEQTLAAPPPARPAPERPATAKTTARRTAPVTTGTRRRTAPSPTTTPPAPTGRATTSRAPTATRASAATMTERLLRSYALAGSALAFFLGWAAVAAQPRKPAQADPRLAALTAREEQLQRAASLAQAIAAARGETPAALAITAEPPLTWSTTS